MGYTDPHKALAAGRFWAMQKVPYLAHAILSMVPREVPLGTLTPLGGSAKGTLAMNDQGILYFEREAPLRWSTPELGSVLIHEALHWVRKHGARRIAINATEQTAWAIATDYEINDDLVAMRLPLPDGGGVQPARDGFKEGQLAEAYYQQLLQKQQQRQQQSCTCGGGSAAGIKLSIEPDSNGVGADGQQDPAVRSAPAVETMRIQVAHAVKAHAQKHGRGSVPLGLERWADEQIKPPKIPWGEKLRRLARARLSFRSGGQRATYARKARRQGGLGYGAGSPQITARVEQKAEVVLAVDTSGSMGKDELDRALAESEAIMRSLGHPVRFMACDAAVHTNTVLRTRQDLLKALRGGGGTDFRPVFEAMEKAKPKPDLLIFITDGGGYAPLHPPNGYHVIWVLVGKHRCRPLLPTGGHITWGDQLEVEED